MGRKIILNLAISLDGYIADPQGGYAWITGDGDTHLDTPSSFAFPQFLAGIDTIVMGRKSFQDAGIAGYEEQTIIVATSQPREDYANVKFIAHDICGHVERLRQKEGRAIWIFGGGELADSFIKADIIDEYIIGIIPIILGAGRPLFLGGNPMMPLHLDAYNVQEGIVILRYSRRAD